MGVGGLAMGHRGMDSRSLRFPLSFFLDDAHLAAMYVEVGTAFWDG